jgi:hypothetical protein
VTAGIEYDEGHEPDPSTAAVSSEDLSAQLLGAEVDGRSLLFRIRLTIDEGAPPGLLQGVLSLHASGYSVPLHVIGRIEE